MTSHFQQALLSGYTHEVPMNGVSFIPFRAGTRAIGTQNLNGCTAVGLFSNHGAILAHIPPMPYPTHDSQVGLRNLEALMVRFVSLYQTNQSLFPPGSTSLIVGGSMGSEPTMDHHIRRITAIVRGQCLSEPHLKLYNVNLSFLRRPGSGTVLIDSSSGAIAVYVEDQLVAI